MTRECPICSYPLRDGDTVVAIMVSTFKLLASDVNYAIETPTECISLIHDECFDRSEYGEGKESEGD